MGYRIAVAGATGNVGREVLSILAERLFPADEVIALASSRSIGIEVGYGEDQTLKVRELAAFDFDGIDIVLSSPGAKVSAEHSPRAAKAGAVVIDNTSHFRMHPDVPLVVPEVNPDALAGYRKRGIIANPNCSTIQLVTALKPLHDLSPIKRVVVATYQSTSGGGKAPMDELFNQTRGIFTNQPVQKSQENFTKQIAFNVIPHIDVFMDDGSTKEEWKIVAETRKILDRIDAALYDDQNVYVHCWGGSGRTGTVVGCWLLRHGFVDPDKVLGRLQELRLGDRKGWMKPTPNSPVQAEFIVNWEESE